MFGNLKTTLRAQTEKRKAKKHKKKRDNVDEKHKIVEKKKSVPEHTSDRSFHLTSLPYEATKRQISSFFVEHGCDVVSCRMVRKEGSFTGVAFLDVLDEKSALAALTIHQNFVFLGRKINVRPTGTKEDLKRIVASRSSRGGRGGRGGRGRGRGHGRGGRTTIGNKRRRDEAPLTKRQRAKRAAIIAARGRGGRGKKK